MLRRLCYATIIACSMLLPVPPIHAAPALAAYDDFSDNSMNPALWTLFIDGTGPVARETNGWVEVTIPADAQMGPPGAFGGGFKSKQCLRGDWDMKIDYFLLDWPKGNGVRIGLGLWPDTAGHVGSVQRSSYGPAESHLPTEAYVVDYLKESGGVPTTHLSGSFRMARVGSRITCGVLVEGEWVELYSAEYGAENYYFAFTAWSHDYAFARRPIKIAFDNFAMLYGELVDPGTPPAEPKPVTPQQPRPAVSAAPDAVARMAALNSSLVVRMPHGRPFFRMQAKDLPGKCGPYKRFRFELPPGKANVK